MNRIYYNGGKMNILIFSDFHEEKFTYNDLLKIKIDPDRNIIFTCNHISKQNIFWNFGKP